MTPKPTTPAVLQASKARRLARLGVIITVRAGVAAYDYPAAMPRPMTTLTATT